MVNIGLTGPLRVEILDNGITARLIAPFTARSLGRIIEVPAGFVTDFASVPRCFWRVLPPWGEYSPAAVVHDYLYRHGHLDREEADQILYDLMWRLGVPRWKRCVMFWAVRLFGGPAWRT